MTLTDYLSSLKKLEGEATPGPWKKVEEQYCALRGPTSEDDVIFGSGDDMGYVDVKPADLALIAAARTALPKLVALVEGQERVIEFAQHDESCWKNPALGPTQPKCTCGLEEAELALAKLIEEL